jgi:hypothetical protein
LHTFVLVGGTHEDRHEFTGDCVVADLGVELLGGEYFLLQEPCLDLRVDLAEFLEELGLLLFHQLDEVLGYGLLANGLPVSTVEVIGFLMHDVDYSFQLVVDTDGDLHCSTDQA